MHKEYLRLVEGSDTAVLMIHGILGTPNHFREFLPLIPKDWTVHCLLLEGHGGSADGFAAASMEKWRNQVARRVEELLCTHRRLYIAAHSMGTLFAFQAAIRHPDRIPGLFLLNTPLKVFVRPSTALNATLLSFGYLNKRDVSAVAMREGLSVQTDWRVWKYLRWIPRFLELFAEIRRTKALLPRLTVPARVFQSAKDELVSLSSCKCLEGHPMIQTAVLEDSGHFGYGRQDLAFLKEQFLQVIGQA